jgi:hypothetical protein
MAMLLLQQAGVTHQLHKHPELARVLLFGPLSHFAPEPTGQRLL